jgi:hypothetical protein
MRVDELPAEELRQEVAAALLGPDGRDCPVISRVSFMRSLMAAVQNESVLNAIIALDADPDPEAVLLMRQECQDLVGALEKLVETKREPQATRQAMPLRVPTPDDIAAAMGDLPF